MFVIYNYNSNYINDVPIHSHTTKEYIQTSKDCYHELKDWGDQARLIWLDNEISAELIDDLKDEHLGIQIAFLDNHQLKLTKSFIQILKPYFISA